MFIGDVITDLIDKCETQIHEIFSSCHQKKPNYSVNYQQFRERIEKTVRKYLLTEELAPTLKEVKDLIDQIHADDLYLALACINGDECAWWDFDAEYRPYLEKLARSLTNTHGDAEEIVANLYTELYGISIHEGRRNSKFLTYSGRGTLRGWLRTIIWHSTVDLHRASEGIVSLEEIVQQVGEGVAHNIMNKTKEDTEQEMIETLNRKRYLKIALQAIEKVFANLEDYEKLILYYYHVENLKLREIAKIVELPSSPLRNWFKRHSEKSTRVHESTIMRWLDKTYSKILKLFRAELAKAQELKLKEIEICLELIAQELPKFSLEEKLSDARREST
jgi:RNA polymerase sigma-70 factor